MEGTIRNCCMFHDTKENTCLLEKWFCAAQFQVTHCTCRSGVQRGGQGKLRGHSHEADVGGRDVGEAQRHWRRCPCSKKASTAAVGRLLVIVSHPCGGVPCCDTDSYVSAAVYSECGPQPEGWVRGGVPTVRYYIWLNSETPHMHGCIAAQPAFSVALLRRCHVGRADASCHDADPTLVGVVAQIAQQQQHQQT